MVEDRVWGGVPLQASGGEDEVQGERDHCLVA